MVEPRNLGAGDSRLPRKILSGAGGYTTGVARSQSGKLAGLWEQQTDSIYVGGGHAMLFHRFDGQLMITLHAPNNSPLTRQRIFELEDLGDSLRVKNP